MCQFMAYFCHGTDDHDLLQDHQGLYEPALSKVLFEIFAGTSDGNDTDGLCPLQLEEIININTFYCCLIFQSKTARNYRISHFTAYEDLFLYQTYTGKGGHEGFLIEPQGTHPTDCMLCPFVLIFLF